MAQTHLFDLIYAGAVLVGFSEDQVKANFAKHLKLSEDKVDKLFSGKRVTLKKALTKDKAEKWQNKLLKIGAETVLVPALNAELVSNSNGTPKTASLFDDNSASNDLDNLSTVAKSEDNNSLKHDSDSLKSSNVGRSQQDYDENMQKRIARAQALIAAQQMEQQSGTNNKDDSMKRLWTFSAILIAAILFLYFYAESIA